jgi:peptidoglycan/xylan/chitin deacetylase (PgdA/CDA1 family)
MRALRPVTVAAVIVLALVACGRTTPGAPTPTGSTPTGPTPTTAAPSAVPTTPTVTVTPTKPSPTKPAPTTTRPTTPAPPFPRSLLGQDVQRIPTTLKMVALTFDAGANANGVPSILDTLAGQHVPATFFLTGDFVAGFPTASRDIAAAGHRIGNHSVDHPYFTDLTDAQIRAELSGAASAIRASTGANPAPLFRFPYGDRDARTIAVVNAAGYVPVRWTVDSLGWQGTMNGTRDAAFVVQRVVAAATPGEIVAMHVGSNPDDHSTLDAAALPGIIAGLRAQGYTFVTLDALLG